MAALAGGYESTLEVYSRKGNEITLTPIQTPLAAHVQRRQDQNPGPPGRNRAPGREAQGVGFGRIRTNGGICGTFPLLRTGFRFLGLCCGLPLLFPDLYTKNSIHNSERLVSFIGEAPFEFWATGNGDSRSGVGR